jgi:Pectate lyase superfamily protein
MVHKLGWLVEDYGALGNGSTDDAAAFAALIGGMKTRTTAHGQQSVHLRSKVYRVNSPIVLDASGLQLHGHNVVGSVIEAGPSFPAGQPLINVVANVGNTQLTDIEIGNLTLRRVNADGPLVRFSGCKVCAVTNCILGACNTYVAITKPGSSANLHLVLTGWTARARPPLAFRPPRWMRSVSLIARSSVPGAGRTASTSPQAITAPPATSCSRTAAMRPSS